MQEKLITYCKTAFIGIIRDYEDNLEYADALEGFDPEHFEELSAVFKLFSGILESVWYVWRKVESYYWDVIKHKQDYPTECLLMIDSLLTKADVALSFDIISNRETVKYLTELLERLGGLIVKSGLECAVDSLVDQVIDVRCDLWNGKTGKVEKRALIL